MSRAAAHSSGGDPGDRLDAILRDVEHREARPAFREALRQDLMARPPVASWTSTRPLVRNLGRSRTAAVLTTAVVLLVAGAMLLLSGGTGRGIRLPDVRAALRGSRVIENAPAAPARVPPARPIAGPTGAAASAGAGPAAVTATTRPASGPRLTVPTRPVPAIAAPVRRATAVLVTVPAATLVATVPPVLAVDHPTEVPTRRHDSPTPRPPTASASPVPSAPDTPTWPPPVSPTPEPTSTGRPTTTPDPGGSPTPGAAEAAEPQARSASGGPTAGAAAMPFGVR